jgi:drug/metabolite transporter (DMT)-like permease
VLSWAVARSPGSRRYIWVARNVEMRGLLTAGIVRRASLAAERGKDGRGSGVPGTFSGSSLGKYGGNGKPMVAVLLALAAAISFGGSDYTAGLASRKTSVLKVTVVAEGVNTALVMPVVLIVSSHPPSASALEWGGAAGVCGVGGVMALYMGFRHAAFSVASPVSAIAAAGLPVLVGVLSGERPGPLSLAGMLLTVPAIVAVSVSAARLDAAQPDESEPPVAAAGTHDAPESGEDAGADSGYRRMAGVMWGLAAGGGFAIFLIGLGRAGSGRDLWPAGVADLAGVITVVTVAALARQLAPPPAGTRGLSLLTGFIVAVGTLSVFLAAHRGLLAVTAVIYSLYPAGTIFLASVLSHERLTKAGILGLCLAAASVSLIAVGTIR